MTRTAIIEEDDTYTYTCVTCGAEVKDAVACSNGDACDTTALCHDCAARLLNEDELCPECTGSEVLQCSKCHSGAIPEKLTDGVCVVCTSAA